MSNSAGYEETALPVRVEKLIPGGQALATLASGKKIMLWNALPGELVNFNLTKNKSKYAEGVATDILETSDYRISPKDSCYLATSPWQIMSYEMELREKKNLVQECLRQQGLDYVVNEVEGDGKEFFYRNKMEYALYWNKETELIELAFRERGSHRKMPVKQSSLEMPVIWEAAVKMVDELNARHEEARKYQSLLVRASQSGEVGLALFENGKPHPILPPLKDKVFGYEYTYAVDGFFQINLPVYEMALRAMKDYVEPGRVLDLYAGVGTIGLSVARGSDLLAVEVNNRAFEELKNNAKNASDDIFAPEVRLDKAENVLDYITYDMTVILDPPRAGCDEALIGRLLSDGPRRIIYLSCNPITAARDLAMLSAAYEPKILRPFNFFPRTPHIELLTVLDRR